MSPHPSDFYRFDGFTIDTEQRVLLRGEDRVHLTPKALDILVALVRRPGQIVDKETLMREVWPDTFVEDVNLAYNIHVLRKALSGTNGSRGEYIETVPKRGYRFIPAALPKAVESFEAPSPRDLSTRAFTPAGNEARAHRTPRIIQTPLGLLSLLSLTVLATVFICLLYADTRTQVSPQPAAAPPSPEPSASEIPEIENDARNITALLFDSKFSEVARRFDSSLKETLKPHHMMQVLKGVKQQGGAFESIARVTSRKEHRLDVVDVLCQFEKAYFVLQITFNPRSEITAMWLIPADNPLPAASGDDTVTAEMKARAREIAGQLVSRSFDEVAADFTEELSSSLSSRRLRQLWNSLVGPIGAFQRIGEQKRNYDVVDVNVHFFRGVLNVRVGFDANRKTRALFVTRNALQ